MVNKTTLALVYIHLFLFTAIFIIYPDNFIPLFHIIELRTTVIEPVWQFVNTVDDSTVWHSCWYGSVAHGACVWNSSYKGKDSKTY